MSVRCCLLFVCDVLSFYVCLVCVVVVPCILLVLLGCDVLGCGVVCCEFLLFC